MSAWEIVSAISYWAVLLGLGYLAIGVVVVLLMVLRWELRYHREGTVFNSRLIYRLLPQLLFYWPVSAYVVGGSMLLSFRIRRAVRRLERRRGERF